METKTIISWGAFALTLVALPSLDTLGAQSIDDASLARPYFERGVEGERGERGWGKGGMRMTEEQRAERKAAFEALTDEEKAAQMAERKEMFQGKVMGKMHKKGKWAHGKGMGNKNVTVETEVLSNGMAMTFTTDDAEALEKLFARADKMAQKEREGLSVEKLSNGIKVTHVTEDEAKLARMKANVEAMEIHKSITHTVEKIENGVVKTITSTLPEGVAKIQSKESRNEKSRENVAVTQVNIENGVQITFTSEDADVVAKMHARADRHEERKNQ